MNINCIVIDDEQLARKGLCNFIKEVPFLTLVGVFSNPLEAFAVIKEENIDLMFLDIQMPKMSGLELLKSLSNPPLTIITTAFLKHALEGYELNVADYLVKPIPFDRFMKAINKIKDYIELKSKITEGKKSDDYFFIKCENRLEKIMYDELLFAEALQNYVMLHTAGKRYISYLTFKSVEEYLPPDRFLKVHKSYIVSLSKIDSIAGREIKIGEHTISISTSNKEEILQTILKNRYLKR